MKYAWFFYALSVVTAVAVVGILAGWWGPGSGSEPTPARLRIISIHPSDCWAKADANGKRHCATTDLRRAYLKVTPPK